MAAFAAVPISRKLVIIGLATVGLALVLNSLASLISTVVLMRRAIFTDVTTQSGIIIDNAAAALAFRDAAAARSTLAVMRAKPSVHLACLYDASGALFAQYADPAMGAVCPASPPPNRTIAFFNGIQSVEPMSVEGRGVGTLYLHGNYNQVWAQVRAQAWGGGVGFVLSALAAWLLMSRLHRTIVDPVAHLSAVATRVSEQHDYSIRATRQSRDEIGSLVDAFNEMLAQVQEREAELSTANLELNREVVERQRIENERTVLLQREREANRLKDEFLAALSHELRTPLNAVLGWTQILQQTGLDTDTGRRGLASIDRNARAQARMIEDLLDISRIVTGKFQLNLHTLDATVLVATAIDVLRPTAAAKAIALRAAMAGSSCRVSADPDRVQQVLWNLLSNAIRFTPSGGAVTVLVGKADGKCTIEVRDTGIGIAPEFLPHVFDRFRQADGSLTRQHGGLGLGLAIVHEIVELHGGTVSAASEGLGFGATFTVSLPLAKHTATPEPEAGSAREAQALAGTRILVVDDDADAREIAATALGAAGAAVVTAATSDEALERACDGSGFSVLVCDIGLPGLDGYEVLRCLREREAASGGMTPAVAMTAHASREDVARAHAAGFGWHVAKPVSVGTLLEAVLEAAAARESTP